MNFENGVQKKTNKTLNTYTWREGATLDKTEYWNDWVGTPTVKNISSYFYDIIGGKAQLKWVTIQDGRPRSVVFMYDQLGQIIKRDETDNITGAGDPHEVWYRFSGRQIGYVGNNGTLDTTYAQSIANRTAAQGNGAFFNGASGSTNAADFDLASDSLNSYAQGSNAGMYVVQQGDTLSSIAANLWGDSALWYKLAEINGLTAETELPEGLPLIIPTGVIRDTNNASTFKPYDPNELMGNLSPTSVAPPKKGKNCGVIGQIILVVIAVVVSYFTAGAASPYFAGLFAGGGTVVAGSAAAIAGGVVGGAIGGAVGSIASQAVGVMTGIQEKFSWNAVALAAIGGGVGGGSSAAGGAALTWQQAVVRGVTSNIITQGIGVATGLQDKFSWAGVAAAGIGAGVFQAVSANTPGAAFTNAAGQDVAATWGNRIGASMASMVADAATRSLIEGSDFGDNIMAALPNVIGQTIGEAIAGRIAGRSSGPDGSAPRDGSAALPDPLAEQRAVLALSYALPPPIPSPTIEDLLDIYLRERRADEPLLQLAQANGQWPPLGSEAQPRGALSSEAPGWWEMILSAGSEPWNLPAYDEYVANESVINRGRGEGFYSDSGLADGVMAHILSTGPAPQHGMFVNDEETTIIFEFSASNNNPADRLVGREVTEAGRTVMPRYPGESVRTNPAPIISRSRAVSSATGATVYAPSLPGYMALVEVEVWRDGQRIDRQLVSQTVVTGSVSLRVPLPRGLVYYTITNPEAIRFSDAWVTIRRR